MFLSFSFESPVFFISLLIKIVTCTKILIFCKYSDIQVGRILSYIFSIVSVLNDETFLFWFYIFYYVSLDEMCASRFICDVLSVLTVQFCNFEEINIVPSCLWDQDDSNHWQIYYWCVVAWVRLYYILFLIFLDKMFLS